MDSWPDYNSRNFLLPASFFLDLFLLFLLVEDTQVLWRQLQEVQMVVPDWGDDEEGEVRLGDKLAAAAEADTYHHKKQSGLDDEDPVVGEELPGEPSAGRSHMCCCSRHDLLEQHDTMNRCGRRHSRLPLGGVCGRSGQDRPYLSSPVYDDVFQLFPGLSLGPEVSCGVS